MVIFQFWGILVSLINENLHENDILKKEKRKITLMDWNSLFDLLEYLCDIQNLECKFSLNLGIFQIQDGVQRWLPTPWTLHDGSHSANPCPILVIFGSFDMFSCFWSQWKYLRKHNKSVQWWYINHILLWYHFAMKILMKIISLNLLHRFFGQFLKFRKATVAF